MKITVIGPVLNEVDFIGYSIMAVLPQIHEIIYALDEKSDDGTRELLFHVKQKYAHEKLTILDFPTFHPSDMTAYNASFNACIAQATGEACWFLHPDMIVTNPEVLAQPWSNAMAWFTNLTSYAGDFDRQITKGRAVQWKNIHARKFGLHYAGAYGSQNEDFYHSDMTGTAYKHYGEEFWKYPFRVVDSRIEINHYCELKNYRRRLEKMKHCLRTLMPRADELLIEEMAVQHPRVTLEQSSLKFGRFEFKTTDRPIPEVFQTYKDEFNSFKKEKVLA